MRKSTDKKCTACGKSNCGCAGYSQGTPKVSPMGYSYGTYGADQERDLESAVQAQAIDAGPTYAAAPLAPQGPSAGEQALTGVAATQATGMAKDAGSMAFNAAKDKLAGETLGTAAGDAAFDASLKKAGTSLAEAGTEQLIAADAAGMAAEEAGKSAATAAGGAASSALSGFGGAAAADLLTKGKVDEKTLLKGGLAMGANMLLPGSGFLVGPALSALGLQDGTMGVPPMGYSDGSMGIVGMLGDDEGRDKLKELAGGTMAGKLLGLSEGTNYAQQDAQKAAMSPEEYQMRFLKEKIEAPVKDFVEKRPMLQAPLALASAAKDFEKGDLNLGKYGGGRLTGGKDRLAYKHAKYGDFEINPESERVSYKKTFRF
jgi:hypothetical protein